MKFLALLACLLLSSATAFAPPSSPGRRVVALEAKNFSFEGKAAAIAGVLSSQLLVEAARAADYEVADLPPTYVPVAFGVILLGGVGWLTSSLGDIMTEESLLGLQSGARAKKEMERSRSSYFKKTKR